MTHQPNPADAAGDDDLEQMTPNQRRALNKALAALETMAALWASEIRLTDLSKRIADVPDAAERAKRIAAFVEQGFIEGAYRHYLDHKDQIEALSTVAPAVDAQPVACWAAYNGVCLQAFFQSKQAAESYAAEMQKNHDLSGSIAAFSVKPLYASAQPEGLRKDALDALRAAEDALSRCYDVTEWPASGESRQDVALASVRAAMSQHKSGEQ